MNLTILKTLQPVTVIGGGDVTQDDVRVAIQLAPTCIAADSGADRALAMKVDLVAVIGDMDSISQEARAQIPPDRFHHIAEQDSTDFDKALRHISAPAIVAIGFTGGRIDHQLAAFHTLVMRPDQHVLLLGKEDIVFLCPRRFSLDMPEGTRVSLFPMRSVKGRSEGLFWPIEGISFGPGVRSGTSNHATGRLVLEMENPAMLCILPRAFIQPVVSALARLPAPVRWHARAE